MQEIKGWIVNVFTEEAYPGRLVFDERIRRVEPLKTAPERYLIPGLIDAHIHIESAMLCPSRFAEAVVPHGTTAVVADPHEIANVLGVAGVLSMADDAAGVPLRVFFTAPSCVPATPFETSGAVLGRAEVAALLDRDDVVALGEVMNFPGVIGGDPEVLGKLEEARRRGKPADGHAPLLTGEDLQAYAASGISTDHESVSLSEAMEKARCGLRVIVRQGSASRNLPALVRMLGVPGTMLGSDDRHPSHLGRGHMDLTLREAVALGADPVRAVRCATLNTAEHYRLGGLGALAPGYHADVAVVRDLVSFEVLATYIGGRKVAEAGRALFEVRPKAPANVMACPRHLPAAFEPEGPAGADEARVRVIGIVPGEIVTRAEEAVLPIENGRIAPDIDQDILRLAVAERYGGAALGLGFVRGLGLTEGALASSVAHDSHNIVVGGTSGRWMAEALGAVVDQGGGIACAGPGVRAALPLPIGGLMSDRPAAEVAAAHEGCEAAARVLGSSLEAPFMTFSFLALPVIPALRLTDKGLFDVGRFSLVPLVAGGKA